MTSTPIRKRKNITFEEKYEIIKDKQKGISAKESVKKYVHSSSTITNEENTKKVLETLQAGEFGSAKKRLKKLEYPDFISLILT